MQALGKGKGGHEVLRSAREDLAGYDSGHSNH